MHDKCMFYSTLVQLHTPLQVKNLQSHFHIHSRVSSLEDASEAAHCNARLCTYTLLEMELREAWY